MAFTSAQIDATTSLRFRLRASDISGSDGDHPTNIVCGGSLGLTITKSGSPTLKRSQLNGKSCLRFTTAGTDYYNIGGGLPAYNDCEVFAVYQSSDASNDVFVLGHSVNNQLRISAADPPVVTAYQTPTAYTPTSVGMTAGVKANLKVIEWRFELHSPVAPHAETAAPIALIYENGYARGPATGVGTGKGWAVAGAAWEQIGALGGGNTANWDLYELILVQRGRSFTMTDRANFYAYFASEYGISPAILQSSYTHPGRSIPKLVSIMHYGNLAGVSFGSLPIERGVNLNDADCASFGAFDAAMASKVGPSGSKNRVYLSYDMEAASPALVPAAAVDYAGIATGSSNTDWRLVSRAYVISLLQRCSARYSNVSSGVYWNPYETTDNALGGGINRGETLADNWDAYSFGSLAQQSYGSPANLAGVLYYAQNLQPEIYPHDLSDGFANPETQAGSDLVAAYNVQQARDLSDYYIKPPTTQEICPVMWMQFVPSAPCFGGASVGDFLPLAQLTQRLRSGLRSGADVLMLGADASYYTAKQWQDWVASTLGPALLAAGFPVSSLRNRVSLDGPDLRQRSALAVR